MYRQTACMLFSVCLISCHPQDGKLSANWKLATLYPRQNHLANSCNQSVYFLEYESLRFIAFGYIKCSWSQTLGSMGLFALNCFCLWLCGPSQTLPSVSSLRLTWIKGFSYVAILTYSRNRVSKALYAVLKYYIASNKYFYRNNSSS